MSVVHSATVRFCDIDRAGVAFFAVIFPLCHAAWEEVLAQIVAPDSLEESFVAGRWPLPVVRAEADFRAPMRLGDRLRVTPSLHALGGRSLAVDYRVVGAADGRLRAEARLTHAAVDLTSGAAVPLAQELREQLKALLGGR